ncbi:MAG: oligosaccharide flippase family protein [Pseudomonadota bacterium]
MNKKAPYASPHAEAVAEEGGGLNAALSIVGQSAQQLSGFVITLLAAGFLSAAAYGTYTLAVVFVEFVVMLTYTGFFHFVVTSDANKDAVLPTVFWVMLGIGVAGGGLMIAFAEPLAQVFQTPDLAPVLTLLGLMQPFAAGISWGAACLIRAGQMRRYFQILIVANAFALLAGSVLLIYWQSLYALIAYRAVRLGFSLCLYSLVVPKLPRLRFDLAVFRAAWRYALGLYGARTMTFFSTFGADLALAYVFSTAEAGLYRFANRLALSTVDIIAQPLRSFSLKSFGAAARHAQPLTPVFDLFFPAALLLTGGFALTVFVLGGALVEALFRPEYLAAVAAVQALSLRAAGRVGQNMVEPTFSATKRTQMPFYHNLLFAMAMLLLVVLVAPFGFVALAWSQAALQIAAVPFALWMIARFSPVDVASSFARAGRAVWLLAGYGCGLWLVWQILARTRISPETAMILGGSSALCLGAATCVAAHRLGILSPHLFAGTSAGSVGAQT